MNHSNNGATAPTGKKKRNGSWNLMDVLLLLIAIVVIGAIVYLFSPFSWLKNMTSKKEVSIQYTVELSDLDEAFLDKIQENHCVVDSVSKSDIGTVAAVDYNNKYTELQCVDGAGVLVKYPNRYNVIVTISVTADYIEGEGYSVNGFRLAVGEKMSLRFPDYAGEGYCIGLMRT